MAYQSNKPESTDIRSQSQIDMQANFIAIKNLIDKDHKTFGDTNEGKHIQLTIPNTVVSVSLPPVTGPTEVMLYAKDEALWFRKHNRPAGDVTEDIDFTTINGIINGSVKLPSGIILKWGKSSTVLVGDVPQIYTFPITFNTCYSVMINPILGTGVKNRDSLYVTDVLAASFIPVCNSSGDAFVHGRNFYYFAVGI
jgi:hypothetical protein